LANVVFKASVVGIGDLCFGGKEAGLNVEAPSEAQLLLGKG